MKYVFTVLLFTGIFLIPVIKKPNKIPVELTKRQNHLVYEDTKLPNNYLEKRLKYAIILEKAYGVPVKVQIAVDLMESGLNKKSKYNNDSWITCRCNYSKKLRKQHSHKDVCFSAYDNSQKRYFKKYKTLAENWTDKCKVISKYKWFKPNQSFEFYSKRLQGTYAESKQYTKSLNNVHSCYLETMKYDILY